MASGSILSVEQEAGVFWRLRGRLLANLLRQAIEQARLRLVLVSLLTGLLWVGLFALFAEGFQFLKSTIPEPVTHAETARAILNIFFASLMVMLVVSTALILYGGLYRSAEAGLLLTMPARVERVFLHKFQEAVLFSSWGFVLLGSPMLAAYGVVEDADWIYYAAVGPLMLGFVFIPGEIAAIVTLAVVRWLPRRHALLGGSALAAAAAAAAYMVWSFNRGLDSDLLTPGWFQEMLARLRVSENRLLPSWWFSSGLLEAAQAGWQTPAQREALAESVMFLALLLSNALVLHQAALWLAGRVYRAGYSRLASQHAPCRRVSASWLDRIVERAPFLLSNPMRLLVIKDLRLFRRDPVQWLQFLIFFGLLALYFLNIRRLSYDVNHLSWINMISFLNLAVVGLILSTFTTRFVFPMISLEGRRFWILGLLPIRRETILWSKFAFASVGLLLPSAGLILLSDVMLRVPAVVTCIHLLVCGALCMGLTGIAVGRGARMPNLRDDSPSRIAAGFGGTLNLVISTAYILAAVLLTAIPCHFYLAASPRPATGMPGEVTPAALWLAAGTAASLVLGLVATVLPLRLGFRAFRELEF